MSQVIQKPCFAEEQRLSSIQTVSAGYNAEGVVLSGLVLPDNLWQAYWHHKQPLELHSLCRE